MAPGKKKPPYNGPTCDHCGGQHRAQHCSQAIAVRATVAALRMTGGAAPGGAAPGGAGAPAGNKRQRSGEAGTTPPPKRAKPVAEMTADERRREAEIVGHKAEQAERKAARLRARQWELLGEVPDVEMTQDKEKEKEKEAEDDIEIDVNAGMEE